MEFRSAVVYGAACLGSPPELVETARLATSAALSGQPAGEDRAVRLSLISADPAKTLTPRPIYQLGGGCLEPWGENVLRAARGKSFGERGPDGALATVVDHARAG